MPYVMINVLTNNIISFEQLGPERQIPIFKSCLPWKNGGKINEFIHLPEIVFQKKEFLS